MQGQPVSDLRGMLFDQFSTMIQATIHGLGVGLLPAYLVQDDLKSGRLVPAWDGPPVSLGDYYLVWPNDRAASEPLKSFRVWLQDQLALE